MYLLCKNKQQQTNDKPFDQVIIKLRIACVWKSPNLIYIGIQLPNPVKTQSASLKLAYNIPITILQITAHWLHTMIKNHRHHRSQDLTS